MELIAPPTRSRVKRPILPVLAIGAVVYLNIMNRCADGFCYTYGWPWVAHYGWSDAGFGFDGKPLDHETQWLPALGDAAVAVGIVGSAVAIHLRRDRGGA